VVTPQINGVLHVEVAAVIAAGHVGVHAAMTMEAVAGDVVVGLLVQALRQGRHHGLLDQAHPRGHLQGRLQAQGAQVGLLLRRDIGTAASQRAHGLRNAQVQEKKELLTRQTGTNYSKSVTKYMALWPQVGVSDRMLEAQPVTSATGCELKTVPREGNHSQSWQQTFAQISPHALEAEGQQISGESISTLILQSRVVVLVTPTSVELSIQESISKLTVGVTAQGYQAICNPDVMFGLMILMA